MTEWLHSISAVWLQGMLLHTVQTSIFVLLIWAIDRAFRPGAAFSYLLWLLALVKALVPPILQIPLPWPAQSAPLLLTPEAFQPATIAVGPSPAQMAWWSLSTATLLIWAAGVFLLAALLFLKNFGITRSLRQGVALRGTVGTFLPGYDGESMGRIPVYESSWIAAPMLRGLIRPRIYLPVTWRNWSENELRLILRHEVAHAQRRDLWVTLLQLFMITLFFFNPFVWLVSSKLNRYREQACDDLALSQCGGSPVEYCRTLCAFLQKGPRRSEAAFAALYFFESARMLKERLQYLLHKQEDSVMRRSATLRVITLAFIGMAMVALSWQCAQKAAHGPILAPETVSQEEKALSSERGESAKVLTPDDVVALGFVRYDTPPKPIGGFEAIQRNLRYPEIARKAGIEGRVVLYVHVNEDGRVAETRVLKSLGEAGCDEAAMAAVKSVRWKPATRDGKPVKVWVAIPIIFRLNKSGPASPPAGVAPPPPPGSSIQEQEGVFVPYDQPPAPVGGFAAIQGHLKYPETARKMGIEGRVILNVLIDENGRVAGTKVLRSLGESEFSDAAVKAIKSVRWKPAMRAGQPVKVWVAIPVIFRLNKVKDRDLAPNIPPSEPPGKNSNGGVSQPYNDAGVARAGATGKIVGKVVDLKTGEPIPGANVSVVGTNLGAATDPAGGYVIVNVPPGRHDLQVSMIGFQRWLTRGVVVAAGKTIRIPVRLRVDR